MHAHGVVFETLSLFFLEYTPNFGQEHRRLFSVSLSCFHLIEENNIVQSFDRSTRTFPLKARREVSRLDSAIVVAISTAKCELGHAESNSVQQLRLTLP